MTQRLRVGVIGCGVIAEVMHLPHLNDLDDLFELRAVCDISRDKAEACARRFGAPSVYESWQDMLATETLDVRLLHPDAKLPERGRPNDAGFDLSSVEAFTLGPGERSIYIAITAVGWVAYARIIRGEILVAKRQDYVTAARAGGLSNVRIMRRHLLPNVITQAFIYGMSDIVQDILAIVTLGYLGLGIPPPTADLGSMINDGQNFLSTHWQLTTIPGLVVVIVGLGLSLVGYGLADLLRPGR